MKETIIIRGQSLFFPSPAPLLKEDCNRFEMHVCGLIRELAGLPREQGETLPGYAHRAFASIDDLAERKDLRSSVSLVTDFIKQWREFMNRKAARIINKTAAVHNQHTFY